MRSRRQSSSASFFVKTVKISPDWIFTLPLGMISSPPVRRMAMKTKSLTFSSRISWPTIGAPASAIISKMVPPGIEVAPAGSQVRVQVFRSAED